MSRLVRLMATTMVVLAACGGGDGDAGATTTEAALGNDSTTTTTTTTTTTVASVSPGAGASEEFCVFIGDYAEDLDLSPIGMSPEDIQALFEDNLDAIKQAEGIAPSEIRGDVGLFVDAYGGFVELMREFEYNFLAMGTSALDDPRLLAMEDPELEAAGERIEAFCGIEGQFIQTPPSSDGGSDGSGGVVPGATLPDDFPDALVPPGGQVVAAIDVGGSQTVGFELDGSGDDVIAYYTEILGDPLFQSSEPFGAAWSAGYEGETVNVTMAEYAPGKINVNVIVE
jgi:hypothetical protein